MFHCWYTLPGTGFLAMIINSLYFHQSRLGTRGKRKDNNYNNSIWSQLALCRFPSTWYKTGILGRKSRIGARPTKGMYNHGNFLCLSRPSATFASQYAGFVQRDWKPAKGLFTRLLYFWRERSLRASWRKWHRSLARSLAPLSLRSDHRSKWRACQQATWIILNTYGVVCLKLVLCLFYCNA